MKLKYHGANPHITYDQDHPDWVYVDDVCLPHSEAIPYLIKRIVRAESRRWRNVKKLQERLAKSDVEFLEARKSYHEARQAMSEVRGGNDD